MSLADLDEYRHGAARREQQKRSMDQWAEITRKSLEEAEARALGAEAARNREGWIILGWAVGVVLFSVVFGVWLASRS